MHPDSQSLDASLEAKGHRSDAAGSGSPRDQAIEDFNAFFEKLSSLDHLQWSSEMAPERPPAAPVVPAAAPPRSARVAMPGAKPRMTVVKSETDLAAPPADAPAASASAAVAAEVRRGRVTARDVARFLKMTLVGLLLFALGLGAGWAALSLPGHFDHRMPTFAQLMERARTLTPARADGMPAADAPAATAPADPLRVVEAGRTAAPAATTVNKTAPKVASKVAAKATARANPAPADSSAATAGSAKPISQPPALAAATASAGKAMESSGDGEGVATTAAPSADGIELPRIGNADPAKTPVGNADLSKTPVGSTDPAKTPVGGADSAKTAAGSSDSAPATATDGPQFTLQVGACSSYACVENYRRMLLSKVSSGAIQVVKQTRGDGAGAIQRIRVGPLEREQAERLKSELTAQDPRFQGAYLIALH